MGNNLLGIGFYLKQSLVMFASNIIIYMIQYLIVFYFGKGASIGLGIIGSLISALMITGLGDSIWILVPWSYSIRLCSYTLLDISNIIFVKQQILQSIIIMIIYTCISLALLLSFSKRWEGRKENY